MKYFIYFILALVGGFLGGAAFTQVPIPELNLGATTARTTITNPWTFSATTTLNGNIVVTTTNTATSSIQAGCWQFYATSTVTAHRFLASTTPGIMYSDYGKCPRI